MSFSIPLPSCVRHLLLPLLAASITLGAAHAGEADDIARLAQAGKGEEALRRIDALLAKQPADAQLRFMKGVMLSETRPSEAIAIFTRLTQDYPALPEPYNNLAVLYAAAGQYDKARAALDKALRTHPAYATAFDNLGDVHARLASQAYDKALQVQPGKPAPAAQLALVRSMSLSDGQAGSQAARLAVAPIAAAAPASTPTPAAAGAVAPAAPAAAAAASNKPVPAPAPVEAAASREVQKQPAVAAPAARPETKMAASQEREAAPRAEPGRPEARRMPVPDAPPQSVRLVRADKADKPDAKARAAQEAAAERESVLNAVQSWARAWSARDVQAYLAHYASDFDPPGGLSRRAWMEERQERIAGKGRIRVDVDKPQVTVEGNSATVRFRQIYASDRLNATSRKTLELERHRGKWLIKEERTGA